MKLSSPDTKEETEYIVPSLRSIFVVIEEAIALKRVSTKFLLAWGVLNSLSGRYLELDAQERDSVRLAEAGTKGGAAQSTQMQQHWYALWMVQNAKNNKLARERVQNEIAKLCCDLWQDKRTARGFEPGWFEKLIRQEVSDDDTKNPTKYRVPKTGKTRPVYLRTSFSKMGWSKIQRLARSAATWDSLPPTSVEGFPPAAP
jgi:hypothetical protein